MAIGARCPDVGVRSRVDGKPGVVERRAGPRRGVVAGGASGGEVGRDVVRILDARVIRLVARIAVGRDRGVVVGDVARRAGYRDVRAGERERGVVVIKSGGSPVRGAVTYRAVQGEARLRVVGIGGLVVVADVTGVAVRGDGGVVVVYVTLRAGHGEVRTRERKHSGGMVESGPAPVDGAVALRAIRGKSGLHVIGVGGRVVIRHVATGTGARRGGEVVADVALRAGQRGVRSGEREEKVVVYRGARP